MNPIHFFLFLATCYGVLAYPNGSGHCNRGGFSDQRNTFGAHQVSKGPGVHTHAAGGVKITVDGQEISSDQLRYLKPNQEYNFRIGFHCNTPFKGFLVRAEGMNNEDLSTSLSVLDEHTKVADRCDPNIGALTHKSSSYKNEIEFSFKHIGVAPRIRLDVTVLRKGGRDTEQDPDRAYAWFHDVYELVVDNTNPPVVPTPSPSAPAPFSCPTPAPTTTPPAPVIPNIPDSAGYKLVYELDIPTNPMYQSAVPQYLVNNSSSFTSFSRIAYYLELDNSYVWVSMDEFTNDARKIGVPCLHLDCGDGITPTVIQQMVSNVNVVSNMPGLTGNNLRGNLEFWPYNYGQGNAINIPGADSGTFDFGDQVLVDNGSYGSMQVHVNGGGSYVGTVFAFNRFNDGAMADLGIGNRPTSFPDWSLASNAGIYSSRKLKIFAKDDHVPPTRSPVTSDPTASPTVVSSSNPTSSAPTKMTPTIPTPLPSSSPSKVPSNRPTLAPTTTPTLSPVKTPTKSPTRSPSRAPTSAPTDDYAVPNIIDSKGYQLVYALDIPLNPNYGIAPPNYSVNNSLGISNFSRIAYYMELNNFYVWVSMDKFTNDARKIGVPCLHLGCGDGITPTVIQQMVTNMNIESNVYGLTGNNLSGNLEFWPYNYSPGNAINIPGASSSAFDFGDQVEAHGTFGSMQVHVNGGGSYVGTVFAFNRFNDGAPADLGMSNMPSNLGSGLGPDWSFAQNSASWNVRKLKVFVKGNHVPPTGSPVTSDPTASPTVVSSSNPTQEPTSMPNAVPSASPTIQFSKMPSESPSLTPSTLPTSLPSKSPSSEPSFTPSWSPSEIPSTTLSDTPTLLPSKMPTTSGICPVNDVLNSTFHFVLPNIGCLRAEVFANGKLEADYSDRTCSNEVFNPMDEFSLFDSIDTENDIATYKQGKNNIFGTMRFRLSPDVTETMLKIISWDDKVGQFAAELSVSSCSSIEATPSLLPSASPSSNPSNLACGIDQIWNETFKFVAGVNCYRLEISENGKLEFDASDSKCSNPVFNPSGTLSVFGSVDTDTKEVFFVPENNRQFKGSIRVRQSIGLKKPKVNILSLDENSKEFVAEVEIPSCVF